MKGVKIKKRSGKAERREYIYDPRKGIVLVREREFQQEVLLVLVLVVGVRRTPAPPHYLPTSAVGGAHIKLLIAIVESGMACNFGKRGESGALIGHCDKYPSFFLCVLLTF